jgi:hypothetical protein
MESSEMVRRVWFDVFVVADGHQYSEVQCSLLILGVLVWCRFCRVFWCCCLSLGHYAWRWALGT